MRSHLQFALAAVLLTITALLLQARSRKEVFPPRQPLSSWPHELADWVGTDIPLPADILEILGPGDFLLRAYRDTSPGSAATVSNSSGDAADKATSANNPYVDLFMAYFPTQRAGDTIHSPKNCLPGAGWSPLESKRIAISVPGHAAFPANLYVIGKGTERQLVIYWYWAHDRGVASEYWAKFHLVADSIRMNRSDGALVRVTTPLKRGENANAAEERLVSFAGQIVPILDNYIPR
jgi:EpsI family protein